MITSSKFEKAYSLNEELHKLATSRMKDDLNHPNNKGLFAAFILGKSYTTHEATMLLCRNQYGEDAFMLSRTLFEVMILVSYVLKDDSDGRLIRYVEHDWVTRKKMLDYCVTKDAILDGLNKKISSGAVELDALTTIELENKRVMDLYNYKGHDWSDKTIKDMAEEVGRGDAYQSIYKLQCIIGHTDARSMNEYMQDTKDGIIIKIGSKSDAGENVLVAAFDFFGTIFEIVSEQLGWDSKQEMTDLCERFSKEVLQT